MRSNEKLANQVTPQAWHLKEGGNEVQRNVGRPGGGPTKDRLFTDRIISIWKYFDLQSIFHYSCPTNAHRSRVESNRNISIRNFHELYFLVATPDGPVCRTIWLAELDPVTFIRCQHGDSIRNDPQRSVSFLREIRSEWLLFYLYLVPRMVLMS